jgi:molybdate transport system ATP-binding protein
VVAERSEDVDGLSVDVEVRLSRLVVRSALDLPGGTLGLIGPSGAGKSTVLRAVAGLLRPTRGRIALAGRTLFDSAERIDLPPERRHIGVVFQDYALFPHLTVAGNVAYGLRASGVARHEAAHRAAEALRRFGMDGLAGARPASLSGGERQRVALARAVVTEPDALLLDEPLSALDAATRGSVATELAGHLGALGLPTILVSHDFQDVVGLADRIAVMEAGRVVQSGTAAELLESPASPFVAAFTGVNFFHGTAGPHGELTAVASSEGEATFLSTDGGSGRVGVVVYPWEVAISKDAPDGSALNTLIGPVRRLAAVGNRVRVTVGSRPPVVAEITEESAARLGLGPGVPVVATWKATGTRLVPASARGT